jgi:hypothetical protein
VSGTKNNSNKIDFPVTNPGSGTGVGDILMGYKGSTFIDAG